MAVLSPVGDAKDSVPGNYYFHTKYGSDSNKVLLKATPKMWRFSCIQEVSTIQDFDSNVCGCLGVLEGHLLVVTYGGLTLYATMFKNNIIVIFFKYLTLWLNFSSWLQQGLLVFS